MSNLTRGRIALNLNESPFKVTIEYDGYSIVFVFSSKVYTEKFQRRIELHRREINQSLSNRFKFNVNANFLADLKLYTTIEKRGFLIFKDKEKIECLNNVVLDGLVPKLTN